MTLLNRTIVFITNVAINLLLDGTNLYSIQIIGTNITVTSKVIEKFIEVIFRVRLIHKLSIHS